MSQTACEAAVWGYRLSAAAMTVAALGQAKLDTANDEQNFWFDAQNQVLADAAKKLEAALAEFPGNTQVKTKSAAAALVDNGLPPLAGSL